MNLAIQTPRTVQVFPLQQTEITPKQSLGSGEQTFTLQRDVSSRNDKRISSHNMRAAFAEADDARRPW